MSSDAALRRWTAGVWPTVPVELPAIGFPGPVGLWEGVAFVSYDHAEHQGWIERPELRHPRGGLHAQFEANQRRYERYEAALADGRGELYLALDEVDLGDVEEVLEFVSTFGYLDVRALDPARTRQWWGVAPPPSSPLRILRYYPGFGDGLPGATIDTSLLRPVTEVIAAQRAAAPTWVVGETLEEFYWGACAIGDLRRAWECLHTGSDPCEVPWANPRLPAANEPRAATWHVSEFFQRTMCDALRGFSPRVWLVDAATGRPSIKADMSPAPADVSLFEVMVLELHRHIAERSSYKRCENPTCRGLFVRQAGTARFGQHHTHGVKYCSRRCAKAVAQRRYRARKAAEQP